MRFTLYAGFVAVAASLASAATVSSANGPTDAQIKEITRTSLPMPFGSPNLKDKNDVGWVYPSKSKILPAKQDGKCNFQVIMDVSRCSGMQTKQEAIAYPYDAYSMDMLHKNMEFQTAARGSSLYAQKTITLNKCGFNGRFFLMDQANDNIFATSRMSVRLILEEGKVTSWVTSDPDSDELNIPQGRSAPLIRRYYSDSPDTVKDRIVKDEDKRGKQTTTLTTTKSSDNYMYLQWC